MKIRSLAITLVFFASQFLASTILIVTVNPVSLASASFNGVDPSVPGTFGISLCTSNKQLDCIESVEVKEEGQNLYQAAVFVRQELAEAKKDKLGNIDKNGFTVWSYDSSGQTRELVITPYLSTPKRRLVKETGTPSYAGGLSIWVHGDEADLTTNVRITARTSWLKPLDVSFFAADPEFDYEKIPGGNRWVFSGTRTVQSGYFDKGWAKKMQSGANADYDDTRFFFGADHAGRNMNESYYDPKCASKGFTVRASNATTAGQPTWDPTTRSLNFNVAAPHRDTQGQLNKGFFKLWVNKAYMKCMWPNSGLDKASSFSVSVYNEKGSKQAATTVVRYAKGELYVAALNFHYSSPTIRLKAKKK